MKITTGQRKRPQKIVLYGTEGIGKTTFASHFPNPVFIDTEGSTDHIDVTRTEKPTSWAMLLSFVQEFAKMPGGYQTLVIDTVDWAEALCTRYVCDKYKKKGIEDFSYGKGYVYVREEMGNFLHLLDEVIAAGMNVVLTAHSQIRKFEQPDEMGAYDRYELKLGQKTGSQTSALIKEWADMVLFANYKTTVMTTDSGKKRGVNGERVLYTTHSPAWDAKNRHGLAPVLPLDYAQIAHCIPSDIIPAAAVNAALATPQPAETKAALEATKVIQEGVTTEFKTPVEPAPADAADEVQLVDNVPNELKDLMRHDGVTLDQVMQVVWARRQEYPAGTPFENLDPDFVTGWIIPFWSNVVSMIKNKG